MSVEVRTPLASCPSPWPSCVPYMVPLSWPSIAIIGPARALASSGRPASIVFDICSAIGSQSVRQVGMVFSSQSTGVHAAVLVTPAGSVVCSSSHTSARRTASATA